MQVIFFFPEIFKILGDLGEFESSGSCEFSDSGGGVAGSGELLSRPSQASGKSARSEKVATELCDSTNTRVTVHGLARWLAEFNVRDSRFGIWLADVSDFST